MKLQDILAIEGITIRLIPAETVSLYSYREGQSLTKCQTLVSRGARQFVQETRPNSLGGKYLVQMTTGQGSIVRFDRANYGVGDSIEAAYSDMLAKTGKESIE